MPRTIAERLERSGNRPSGFDYMRLFLATAVVASHTINVLWGAEFASRAIWHSPLRPLFAFILPMFFALSGFLVAGSLERSRTLMSFLGLRAIRLVPALVVDTLLAALLLGPLFTKLSSNAYFGDPAFYRYFLNIVGDVQFVLPGVFETNPTSTVNGQLWTLPYELYCYAGLAALALLGLARNRRIFLGAVAVVWLFLLVRSVPRTYLHADVVATATPTVLVAGFLMGVAAYFIRDRIVASQSLFAASLIAIPALMVHPIGDFFAAIPIVYAVVYLGTSNPRRLKWVAGADYSYGIFLYGFPVQQSVVALLPGIPWYLHFPVSYGIVLGIAMLSWHFVEKPALALRPFLYALEDRFMRTARTIPLGRLIALPPVPAERRKR